MSNASTCARRFRWAVRVSRRRSPGPCPIWPVTELRTSRAPSFPWTEVPAWVTEPSAQPAAAQRTTNITMGDDVLGTCDKPAVLYADNAVSSSAGSAPEPQEEGDEAGMA